MEEYEISKCSAERQASQKRGTTVFLLPRQKKKQNSTKPQSKYTRSSKDAAKYSQGPSGGEGGGVSLGKTWPMYGELRPEEVLELQKLSDICSVLDQRSGRFQSA